MVDEQAPDYLRIRGFYSARIPKDTYTRVSDRKTVTKCFITGPFSRFGRDLTR